MGGSSGGMGFGMGWLWMLLILIGLGLLVYVAVRLARRGTPPSHVPDHPPTDRPSGVGTAESPRKILEERYARGEIDTDEFHARLRVIEDR